MISKRDTWASGAAYEPYVGRWSRLVARTFLTWLAVPPGSNWLDVGCGTGALTEAILQDAHPGAVAAIDPAPGFLAYAARSLADSSASLGVGDARELPFAAGVFGAAVSGLALNFVPTPARAVVEMMRVTRHDGVVAAYVWDYAGQMQMMRVFWDAAVELDPVAAEQDEGRRFPVCEPGPLAGLFESAGLGRVDVGPIQIATHFRDFDDFWSPFLGGQGPAPSYVTALGGERRAALMERIKAKLPVAADGSIRLTARAWAVRGTRP